MATHSSVLAWRLPGTGKPGGLPFMGSHRVGHDWSDLAAAAAPGQYHLQISAPAGPPPVTLSHAHSQSVRHRAPPKSASPAWIPGTGLWAREQAPPTPSTLGALVSGGVRAVKAQGDHRLPEAGPLVPPPSDSVGGAGPGAAGVPRPAGPLRVLARRTLGGVTEPHTRLSAAGTFSVSSPLPSTSNRSAWIMKKL